MSAATTLRDRWRAGRPTLGAWLSIPTPASAEATARVGFDYVCIDTQHGGVEYSDSVPMIQAILLGGSSPIVRVPWNEPGIIGKMLDAGAQGVIIPMVNSVEEAEAAARACRYVTHGGARSWGPGLAAPRVDGHYLDWARDHVACIPMIETTQAIAALDDILAVDGIDAVYVGPADLSLTLGLMPQNNDGAESFDDALATIVAACERAGVIPGIHASGTLTPRRLAAGFRMVTVTTDMLAMKLGLEQELAAARGGQSAGSDSMY
ncbi:MAG: aldolase/citrate lyase family protein [Actinomycetota bacterium]